MPRLIGVNIPDQKKTEIALTYIYGVGRKNVAQILKGARVDGDKKAKDLTAEELAKLQKAIETIPVEGILRKMVSENIKRLKQIGTYRGLRHIVNLPVRGQRTRSNARTKRGKRMTVGALKKEALQKQEVASAQENKGK